MRVTLGMLHHTLIFLAYAFNPSLGKPPKRLTVKNAAIQVVTDGTILGIS